MSALPFTVRVPSDLKSQLEQLADRLGRPRSWVVNRALETYLNAEEWHLAEMRQRIIAADTSDFAKPEEVDAFFQRWK